MSKTEERRLRRQLDLARSALRVIHIWATYDLGAHLDAPTVATLTKKTLEKMEDKKEKK